MVADVRKFTDFAAHFSNHRNSSVSGCIHYLFITITRPSLGQIGVQQMSSDDDLPSIKQARKERKEYIASLKESGNDEQANLIAQCRKGNRCYQDGCPVCHRRYEINLSRTPGSVVKTIARGNCGNSLIVLGISIDAIRVIGHRRPINEKKLRALKASIVKIGLQTPITVRFSKNRKSAVLVAGLHRLIAMKELGAGWIPCFEKYEEVDGYLWERSEHIYRAELRVLERAEAINEMRQAILQQGGQVAPPGGRQPKDIGIKRA